MKLKQKNFQSLDDEFAKDVDEEAETLEELKKMIKERLEEEQKTRS